MQCSIEKFFNAVASGDIYRVKSLSYDAKYLTQGIRISQPQLPVSVNYGTVFHLAAELGHIDMIRFLVAQLKTFEIARLAEIDRKNSRTAAFEREDTLLPCLDYYDQNYETALMIAIRNRNSELVIELLKSGCNVNLEVSQSQGSSHSKPLWVAVERMHEDVVQILLEHGAEPNAFHLLRKKTCLHLAIEMMDQEPEKASRMIDLLLAWGADSRLCSGKNIKVARLIPLPNSAKFKLECLNDAKDESDEEDEEDRCRTVFRQNPQKYLRSRKCREVEERASFFSERLERFVYMDTGMDAIELAASKKLYVLSVKLTVYPNATAAALAFLRFARVILNNKAERGSLSVLPLPMVTKILLHMSKAFGNLTLNHVNAMLDFASNRKTLRTTKLSFLQQNVFCFFREKIPAPEAFLLLEYADPKSHVLKNKTR